MSDVGVVVVWRSGGPRGMGTVGTERWGWSGHVWSHRGVGDGRGEAIGTQREMEELRAHTEGVGGEERVRQ